ncbi:hypothetical protein PLESTB_000551800 [Pleodorina starrii]|uniref:Uncharacterized protein n=1 Tax=Pleodorina starrii TaxID=330485 RepID=A0A9W6BGV2_9CHLO|nr:hypothetical protein PLESTM_000277000 [Pleodorina starrii]GLC51819.1 hypothetical protein PLESTB_000551800 [Pleodorina starrii]GLC69532.1 hypothetical protein PLESTF_000842400 [Pleodorina starrii]
MVPPLTPASGRRLWTLTKIWLAVRDVPEVAILAFLGAGALSMAAYTYHREMFTAAGESFPSVEVRRDPEKQLALTGAPHKPSIFYRVAQWKATDTGYNIGVFDNRFMPYEHNLPTQGNVHSSSRYETNTTTKPAAM